MRRGSSWCAAGFVPRRPSSSMASTAYRGRRCRTPCASPTPWWRWNAQFRADPAGLTAAAVRFALPRPRNQSMNFRALTRLALAPAALALLLAACQPSEPAAAAATPAAPAAAAPAETIGDEPALDPSAAPAGEDAAGQDQAPAAVEGDSAAPPPPAATSGATFATQGEHYDLIPGGQPFEPLEGKIEVVEVFNYVCPACAMFQPLVNNWKARLPADVRFTYVPAPFGGNWDPYVRAFYAAEAMGIGDAAHDGIFQAIHVERTLKGERGTDSAEDLGRAYAKFGADPA